MQLPAMSNKYFKNDEEMLAYYYGLPSDEMDSDVDADEESEDDCPDSASTSRTSTPSSAGYPSSPRPPYVETTPVTRHRKDPLTPVATSRLSKPSTSRNSTQSRPPSTEITQQGKLSVTPVSTPLVTISTSSTTNVPMDQLPTSQFNEKELLGESWTESLGVYFEEIKIPDITNPQPKHNFSKTDNELAYFSKIMTDDMIEDIVTFTNIYASQERTVLVGKKQGKKIQNWVDTTKVEMKAFFGLLIIMAIHSLPHLSDYRSSDPMLGVEAVSKVMTLKRYKKLVETLHLNDNYLAVPKGENKNKLRLLIDALNESSHNAYQPSNRLSVDESMIPSKGRSSMKQYMPKKPVKRGYKVWCLADSTTGFITKFQIYTGKLPDAKAEYGLGERVVMELCQPLINSKCLVLFDNFFTSDKLMRTLLSNGIYSIGTVRTDRKGLPKMLKTNDKLSRGEFMFSEKGAVAATKWQDSTS